MIRKLRVYRNSQEINLPKYLSLQGSGLGKMRLRAFPAVMRIHSSKKKDGHEKQYSELLLYTSWRKEEDFHAENAELCIQKFLQKQEEIKEGPNQQRLQNHQISILLMENQYNKY